MPTEIELPGGGTVIVDQDTLTIDEITVHQHKVHAHTTDWWKNGKDAYRAYRDSWGPEFQELENALWMALISGFVDYAQGESLNILGRIVGEGRNGRNDAQFRVRVKARIAINESSGHTEDILRILALCEPAQARIRWTPPAAFVVSFDAVTAASPADLAAIIREAKAAGVGVGIAFQTSNTRPWAWGVAGRTFCDESSPLTGGALGHSE